MSTSDKNNDMTLALTLFFLQLIVFNNGIYQSFVSSESITSDVGGRHCDEDLCHSTVERCLSKGQCQCDFRNDAICAKDCIDCLENKFGKCCACVGLCPATEGDLHTSHVGDTSASDGQLFRVLTETDDIKGRWTIFNTDVVLPSDNDTIEVTDDYTGTSAGSVGLKCTVAFIAKPMSMTKCKKSCTSMGASFFRWFHDGCCQCIGDYCTDYGINESKCKFPNLDI